MKKFILIISLLLLASCSNQFANYEGAPLNIAVIGNVPEMNNEKITFKTITLEEFNEKYLEAASELDAVMITPGMFEKASEDRFIEVYNNSKLPIIFFDSPKRHFPFVNDSITYNEAQWESLNNGSHTTIYINKYLADVEENKQDVWYFYLKDEKMLNELYEEVFRKIEELFHKKEHTLLFLTDPSYFIFLKLI